MFNKVKCRNNAFGFTSAAKKIFLLSATLFLSTLVVNAQTTYNVLTYTEPKGYKKETKINCITYTKSDAKTGTYCIISLYAQSPSSGDLVKDFDNDWATLVKPLGVTAAPQKDNGDEITGWKTYTGAANFEFGGATSIAVLTTAKKDNANVAVLIVTNTQSFLTTDVDAFFGKLKLGKPLITKQVAKNNDLLLNATNDNFGTGKLDGVWIAYFLSYVTKGMMFDQKVFLSSSRFLNDMPNGGLDNFTPNANNPVYTYTLNGNNGKYIDAANKYPGTFKVMAPNKIELESHTYFKSANPNGKFINASYTSWSEENSPEFKAAPKGDRPVINFFSNGKFEDEGIFKHLQYEDPTKKAGKGTYSIKNYSLYLNYDDGRPIQKFSIATFGEAAQFEDAKVLLIYGGQFFKMKNK
jgi:hypothetical protein